MIVFDVYCGPVFLESLLGFGVSSGEFRDQTDGSTTRCRHACALCSPESPLRRKRGREACIHHISLHYIRLLTYMHACVHACISTCKHARASVLRHRQVLEGGRERRRGGGERLGGRGCAVNSFQTTLTPNPEKLYNASL